MKIHLFIDLKEEGLQTRYIYNTEILTCATHAPRPSLRTGDKEMKEEKVSLP